MAPSPGESRFPDTSDPKLFERFLLRPLPRKAYVIYFTPRSGSSWLTDVAERSGRLGSPGECFNPNFLPAMTRSMQATNLEDYICVLVRRRQSAGVFGFEITHHQLRAVFPSEETFLEYFGHCAPIWLIREDIVLQAISLLKMQQTMIAHHNDIAEESVRAKEADFAYDADGIRQWLLHILAAERQDAAMFKRFGIAPLRLSYERNMQLGSLGVLNRIAAYIGESPVGEEPLESGHKQLRTDRNTAYAERFRAEHAELVSEVDAERAPWLEALSAPHPEQSPLAPVSGASLKGPKPLSGQADVKRLLSGSAAQKSWIFYTTQGGTGAYMQALAGRSGSLGDCGNYFVRARMAKLMPEMGLSTPAEYVEALQRKQAKDGVFSAQITHPQLLAGFDSPAAFLQHFAKAGSVWLIWEDVVQQAVHWAVTRGVTEYDPAAFGLALDQILATERDTESMFARHDITPLRLSREFCETEPAAQVLALFTQFDKDTPPPAVPRNLPDIAPLSEDVVAWARRFRLEVQEQVADAEAERASRLASLEGRRAG